jgi:hypothetical protein
MKKILKKTMIVALLACLSAVVFVSCTDFFTNSWAETAKRDYSKIKVDASNVDDLLKAARGDPEMALEILGKIKGAMDGASAADRAKLREAALRAAAQGTNVAGLIVENIGELTKNLESEKLTDTEAQKLLNTMLGSIPGSAGHASSDLAAILPGVKNDGTFEEDFPATEDELMQAAVILILGEVKDGEQKPGEYLNDFLQKDLNDSTVIQGFTPEQKALAGIVNKMQEDKYKDGVLAGMLKPKNTH